MVTLRDDGPQFLEDKLDPAPAVEGAPAFVLGLVPYERTTTYRTGTAAAPEAVVEASGHVELWDETLRVDAASRGVVTVRGGMESLGDVRAFAAAVRRAYPDALPGFVGGEHAVTPALLAGCLGGDGDGNVGLVWIDAHADLRDAYLGSPENHACAARRCLGFGPIVQVGVRTLDEEEARFLESTERVRTFRRWDARARAAIDALPEVVYLSIDADGFSPAVVRAVGTPEPGGLSWDEVVDVVETVFRSRRVIAYDVVELCPDPRDTASSFTVAKLVYKVMACHARYALEPPPAGGGRRS